MNKEFEMFIWGAPRDQQTYQNLVAFAKRHDIAMIVSCKTSEDSIEYITQAFEKAKENGIMCWLATGVFHNNDKYTDVSLTNDEAEREEFLNKLAKLVEVYDQYYPDGRVILWHEEPLFGNWSGSTYAEQVANIPVYGPTIFKAEKDTVKNINPNIEVGIFIHHPQAASKEFSEQTVFAELMTKLRELDALPDFTYLDMYRGYYEVRSGAEITNAYLMDIISHIKECTDERPVYYLGQAHTIKISFTPSKKSIRDNMRVALKAGADGLGWYMGIHGNTKCGFDSFLPCYGFKKTGLDYGVASNDSESRRKNFNMFTGSKDRFLYAFYSTMEMKLDFDFDEKFDLWLYGNNFNFYENSLYLKNVDGEWCFIGDFSGYIPAGTPYDNCNAVVFHGLDRKQFFLTGIKEDKDQFIEVQLSTANQNNEVEMKGIFVMPYFESAVFKTDFDAAEAIENNPVDIQTYSLGNIIWPKPINLSSDDKQNLRIELPFNAKLGILKKDLNKG